MKDVLSSNAIGRKYTVSWKYIGLHENVDFFFPQDGQMVITKATGIADNFMAVALIYNRKTCDYSLFIILGLPFFLLYEKL